MRKINRIIVHCSDSDFGDVEEIRRWHVQKRNFADIGYHYVILNGCRKSKGYVPKDDGVLEIGRPIKKAGAHCKGHNNDSIGVCLVGRWTFTARQLYEALPKLLWALVEKYGLELEDIHCHYEYSKRKTCPNIDVELLRESVGVLFFHPDDDEVNV